MSIGLVHTSRRSPPHLFSFVERWVYIVLMLGLIFVTASYCSLPVIKKFELSGNFINLDARQIEKQVRAISAGANYFTLNLPDLRRHIESLVWVKRAHVSRVWPQIVTIEIEEHHAYAILNGSAMLSDEGFVFHPPHVPMNELAADVCSQELVFQRPVETLDPGLPIVCADPRTASRLLRMLQKINTGMRAIGLNVLVLREEPYQALNLRLDNGWVVALGSHRQEERAQRFFKVFPQLTESALAEHIARIDLRYPDGFAIACRGGLPCQL